MYSQLRSRLSLDSTRAEAIRAVCEAYLAARHAKRRSPHEIAAQALGVSDRSLYRLREDFPELDAAIRRAMRRSIDPR